jgi:hypothetical protein
MAAKRKRAKKPKKWIQAASARMKKKGTVGSFTKWCKRRGFGGVTDACIAAGKKAKSAAIRKKANFAANVRRKRR